MKDRPISADQALFDELLLRKRAEFRVNAGMTPPREEAMAPPAFDFPDLSDPEIQERIFEERERRSRAFSAGGFEGIQREIESITRKIQEAHERLALEGGKPTHILTTPENLERIKRELTVTAIDCEKGTITFSDASDLRNFDVGMTLEVGGVKIIADPDCPRGSSYYYSRGDELAGLQAWLPKADGSGVFKQLERIKDLVDAGIVSQEEALLRLLDAPKVKPASVADLSALLKKLWPQESIREQMYEETPFFKVAMEAAKDAMIYGTGVLEVGKGALVDAWDAEMQAARARVRNVLTAADLRGPPEEPPGDVRVPWYAELHCSQPGYNFMLTLDGGPKDNEGNPLREFTIDDLDDYDDEYDNFDDDEDRSDTDE